MKTIITVLVSTVLVSVGVVTPLHIAGADESVLEEVIVTAEFRPVSALELPASISVFDQEKNRPSRRDSPGAITQPGSQCEPLLGCLAWAFYSDSRHR